MQAYLIDDAVLRSNVEAAPPGALGVEQVSQWGAAHGQPLEVISWEDSNFMLVADAFEGLPEAVEALYGCQTIHGRPVDPPSLAIGYLPASRAREILAAFPEPDFDNPASEVIAAREEVEGWLRRAEAESKSIVVLWD